VPKTRVAHGSPPAGTDVNAGSKEGRGNGVFVGSGVRVGVSVGGRGVAVGIAA